MAKKRSVRPGKASSQASKAVTAERAARLYRLIKLLGEGPQTRPALTRRLHLDIRGFYRDLELLRDAGIEVPLTNRHYALADPVKAALARLPFPDPHLTLGEAAEVAKGRTPAHRKLKDQINQIVR